MPGPRGGERLPRASRVLSRADFLRLQKASLRAHAQHFLVTGARSAGGSTRLGVVASKKVGGAVERNRAKRLAREVFRRHQAVLPESFDVVVIAKVGAHELSYAAAETELVGAFDKL